MPFIPNTPESLIARSDSKNPSSTCCGVTNSGRPCRRAISPAEAATISHNRRHQHHPGIFCWQHKDQASSFQPSAIQRDTIKERTSVDTLVDRLGLLEVADGANETAERRKARRKLANDKENVRPSSHAGSRTKPKQSSIWSLCCMGGSGNTSPAPRPAKIKPNVSEAKSSKVPSTTPQRPSLPRDPSSRELLRLIPRSATPQTASALLAELAKPISDFDEEGYIYMFWLTPSSLDPKPVARAASSLLEPPSSRPEAGRRRTSDVLRDYSTRPDSAPEKKTILLKIGRASNVQRRLNEWKRQCGYDLSLIRYYPYQPSQGRQPAEVKKVFHAHKVERLIHIELASRRAGNSGKCEACDREHREWFEIDASKDGVKAVDEVIRRWVDWDLQYTP